mgnify:CR=1 FL=1
MVTYTDLLPKPTENQQAFILDHGKTEDDGQLKYADDAKSYGWNMRQYGKLKAGAVVLNRHPGKITKDRKWEIYGGGYVESVSDEDENGNLIPSDVAKEMSHKYKEIMIDEKNEDFTIRAKTGWEGKYGWYVGYIETKDDVWFFATNIDTKSKDDLIKRKEITLEALKIKLGE